jgi:hypothetical protein
MEEIKADPAIPAEQIWKPAMIDESIKGVLESRNEAQFGKMYWILTEKGKKCFYGSTVLDALMDKVKIGASIEVVFKGLKPATKAGHNPTKIWKVYEDRIVQERVK